MNLAGVSPILGLPAAPAPGVKAENAARDFEAVLLTSLLESLQKSFADTAGDASAGSENYAAMGTQALASAIAARNGIGIARLILHQWQQTKVPGLNDREVTPAT